MKLNLSNVELPDSGPLPEGKYRCLAEEIVIKSTSNGDPFWRVLWRVQDPPFAGCAIFDNLVFSVRNAPRIRLFLDRLGINTSGDIDLKPDKIIGRELILTVKPEPYTTRMGASAVRNKVTYNGFEAVAEGARTTGVLPKPRPHGPVISDHDDTPF